MKIQFGSNHLSIKQFNPVDLPDFTIFTGLNGSGKTQLLEALKNGNVLIDSIKPAEIVLFDHIKFKIENEQNFTRAQIIQDKQVAWILFSTQKISGVGNLKQIITNAKNKNLTPEECGKLKSILKEKEKPLLRLNEEDIRTENDLNTKFENYSNEIQNIFSHVNLINNTSAQGVFVIAKKLDNFLDEITELTFKRMYVPTNLKENFLPTELGKAFLEYRLKEYEELHLSVDTDDSGQSITELKKDAEQFCLKSYGGSTPWEIVNEFLRAYRNFDYKITFPDVVTTASYTYKPDLTFSPELVDQKRNLSIKFNDLSSGEKVLFSLALCLFKGKSDNIFPKLLLLDEVDATLHPTMIENLLNVIKNFLITKGTKVILATHSPTTVALSPEESLFIVNKEGTNRIEKHNRKDALEILTQGYMTLEGGIKLFDQVGRKEISIMTEGKNTKYIEKAIDLFAPDIKDKVEIVPGVEAISGWHQLKTVFAFFKKANHNNKFIFVWDNDMRSQISKENNTYPFVFQKNPSNTLAKNGIENLFDDPLFTGFTSKTTDSRGIDTEKFDWNVKGDFMDHVLSNSSTEEFKNFKPLIEFIKRVLNDLE